MVTKEPVVEINSIKLYSKDDMVVRASDQSGQFEPETFSFWLNSLVKDELAVDIGAYTGIYSLAADNAGCSVIAFEPNSLVLPRLTDNILLNGCENISVFSCAISDQHGTKFFTRKNIPLTSAGSISSKGVEVQCRTLDSYIGKACKVCAIKIDVEGHEYQALVGASQTIQRNKPMVIAEVLNETERERVTNLMLDYGYVDPFVCDKRNLIFIP